MSDPTPKPYIARCGLCEQGVVRVVQCSECGMFSALCDECEALWKAPATPHANPAAPAEGQHPKCPHCEENVTGWNHFQDEKLAAAGFGDLIVGRSV